MPRKGFSKPDPVDHRLKVGLTAETEQAIRSRAEAAGMTTAGYVRQLIEFDLGVAAERPKVRAERTRLVLLAEAHHLAMQIKRIGVNVNQIARQANTRMVPLTRQELAVMQADVADAMAQAVALFQKIKQT